MKHYQKNVLKIITILILFFGSNFDIIAQEVISRETDDYLHLPGTIIDPSCPGSGCEITLPSIKIGELRTFEIPLLYSDFDTVYISTETGSCDSIINNLTISNNDNFVTVLVNSKCKSGTSRVEFLLHAKREGYTDQVQFYIPVKRDRAKIVFVLDISGSMGSLIPGTSDTRISELKDAVNMLAPKFELFKQTDDSIGMTYFSSDVIQPDPQYFPTDFILIDDSDLTFTNWSSSKIYLDILDREPLQMTALGEGLLDAKNKLSIDNGSDVRRMVFLFTDGLQNWGNKLKSDGLTFQTGTDSLNNYQTDPKDSIYYFPVATWAAGDQPELLQSIVDANKGEVLFVTPGSTLTNWFNNQLVNMLNHGSPQIIMEKSAHHISGEIDYSFNLNENINTLAIELSTKGNISMKIFKEGIDITSKARVKSGNNFNIIYFSLPIIGNTPIHSEGEWNIKLSGDSEKSYNLSVLADDHNTSYNCYSDKSIHIIGDTLHLKTKIEHNGVNISGASVKAILLKPGDDLGHLLSTYETPISENVIDSDSEASNKFNELLTNDSTFFNALLPTEQIITLSDMGNGEYKAYYSNTELSGIYNVIFLIKGQTPEGKELERTKTISNIFVFGQIEQEEPEVVDNAPKPGSGNYNSYMVFKIRPKNKFGYYMGPGFKSKINVRIKSIISSPQTHKTSTANVSENQVTPFLAEIKDNLDGSYYIYVANMDDPAKWDLAINVRDEVLYDYASTIPVWFYILAIILFVLAILFKKAGKTRVLIWIILLIWLIIIILKYIGIINFL